MKLYVDDVRQAPEGWQLAKTAGTAIAILMRETIEELSLDHDLGDPEAGTGYDVIVWLEEKAFSGNWQHVPPVIWVHSANPIGRQRIQAGIDAIEQVRNDFVGRPAQWCGK